MSTILISNSPFIETIPASPPYVPESGVVCWNGSTQQLEVMSQHGAKSLGGSSYITLASPMIDQVVNWAMTKMSEERRLAELCQEHPGLKDLKEKYEVMLALVQKQKENEVR